MSENLDLVRSIYAAWERGDFSSVAWADPAWEFAWADGPAPGNWTGPTAGGAFHGFLSAWEDLRIRADEVRELDSERVLVLVQRSGRGKRSGVELGHVGTRGAHVFQLDGGKVTRLVAYSDRDRALAALGLEE